jgi:hypothetical protein
LNAPLYPVDPITYAWAACNPGKRPPAELECRPLPVPEEVEAQTAAKREEQRIYQRQYMAERRRRAHSAAGQDHPQ